MRKVFVLGGATLDTIIEYENMETIIHQKENFHQSYLLIEEGQKIEVAHQETFSGGGATNVAVSLKKQGYEVLLNCKIGQDLMGDRVRQELERYGVSTQYFVVAKGEQTASSFVVPSLSGDRTVFAYRGANAHLTIEDVRLDLIKGAEFVYISSLSKTAAEAFPLVTACARRHGVKVAINPGGSQLKLGASFVKAAISEVDILILNYEEAEQLMLSLIKLGEKVKPAPLYAKKMENADGNLLDVAIRLEDRYFSLRQFFETILTAGVRIVVVTHGKAGVYVATEKAMYFHPSLPVKVKNTLGAGDAFSSAFVGSLYAGEIISTAIRKGLVNSASVISYPDAKSGLLEAPALNARAASIEMALLQDVSW